MYIEISDPAMHMGLVMVLRDSFAGDVSVNGWKGLAWVCWLWMVT